MTIYIVHSFYPKLRQAKKIAKLALRNNLAACVNINKNVNSLYIWKNKMCEEREVELCFKTHLRKVKSLISFIELKHPYECPPIIAFPAKQANKLFLNWVKNQTI